MDGRKEEKETEERHPKEGYRTCKILLGTVVDALSVGEKKNPRTARADPCEKRRGKRGRGNGESE